jgi:hypothetical protein
MTTDFRAELERLVKAYDDHGGRWPDDDVRALYQAVQKARAALAAPEQGPTEAEVADLAEDLEYRRLPQDTSTCPSFLMEFARAVLARWGRPAVEPVPQEGADG